MEHEVTKRFRINAERTQTTAFEIEADDQSDAERKAEREAEQLPDNDWHTQSIDIEASEA